jgi:hypothetical protein
MKRLGAGALILVVVGVIAVVALIPLLLVYRSTCPEGDSQVTTYSFVLPWSEPPAECRNHQSGLDLVREQL